MYLTKLSETPMLRNATMSLLFRSALVALTALPAGAVNMADAQLLVESQVQAAAAAVAVLEKKELPPAERAALLLPIAAELARLHALRAQVNAAELEAAESAAASDAGVQQLVLRLLRAMELCAASDYAGSTELAAAVYRLALAIEGELDEEVAVTGQNGAG